MSDLVIFFMLLGPVVLFATDVTWRSYIMTWLIIYAIVVAAKFASNKGPALVLSTVSLAGLLWLWVQEGGAHGHYVVGIPLPAVAALALASTVYGLILGRPEICRRADARRETERQLRQAEGDLTGAQAEQRLAHNQIGELEDKIGELKDKFAPLEQARQRLEEEILAQQDEIARLQGTYDRAVAKLRDGQSAAQQELRRPDEEHGLEQGQDGEQIPDDVLMKYYLPANNSDADTLAAGGPGRRLVRVRCFLAPSKSEASMPWPDAGLQPQSGPDQQQRWIVERTIVTVPANSIVDPRTRCGDQHHAGFGDQIRDAFDEYAADVIVNPAYDKITEWWEVKDPGRVNAAAQTSEDIKDALHQFFLGAPANSVCRALGATVPVANAAGGVIGALPLRIDGPMRAAKMFFQFVGIVVGVVTGIPVLQIACTKSLFHDLLQEAVAEGIKEIGHNLSEVVSQPASPAPATVMGMKAAELAERAAAAIAERAAAAIAERAAAAVLRERLEPRSPTSAPRPGGMGIGGP